LAQGSRKRAHPYLCWPYAQPDIELNKIRFANRVAENHLCEHGGRSLGPNAPTVNVCLHAVALGHFFGGYLHAADIGIVPARHD